MIWRKDRQEGTETHFISRSMASTTIWNWSLGKAFSVDHFISNRGVRSKAQLQREATKNIWVSSLNKVLASQAKNRFRFAVTIEKVSLRAAWALVSPPKTVFYFRIQQLLSSAKYFFAYFTGIWNHICWLQSLPTETESHWMHKMSLAGNWEKVIYNSFSLININTM